MLLILLTEFATFESERAVDGKLKRRVTFSKVNFCRRKYNQHMLCAIVVWRHFGPVGRRYSYPPPNSSPSRFQGQALTTSSRFNVQNTRNARNFYRLGSVPPRASNLDCSSQTKWNGGCTNLNQLSTTQNNISNLLFPINLPILNAPAAILILSLCLLPPSIPPIPVHILH
jgi:hypothetical protein